jgi:hypothetical protein
MKDDFDSYYMSVLGMCRLFFCIGLFIGAFVGFLWLMHP